MADNVNRERVTYDLEIVDPQGNRRRYALGEIAADIAVTLGRQEGNDLTFDDQRISRQHALIACTPTGCRIVDMNSSNGTYLNDTRIPPEVPIPFNPGDTVRAGSYQLILHRNTEVMDTGLEDEIAAGEAAADQGAGEQTSEEGATSDKQGRCDDSGEPPGARAGAKPGEEDRFPPGLSLYSQKLITYLPGIYHTDFMRRFLALFETILLPIEWTIGAFDLQMNPGSATLEFLPWLEAWFDITADPAWSEAQRRQLLSEAPRIFARRGTRWALSRVLEIYTGRTPTVIDTGADLAPFTFKVIVPAGAAAPGQDSRQQRDLIERLIDANKPAHTFYTLEFEA